MPRIRLFAVLALVTALVTIQAADGPSNDKLNKPIADFTLTDAGGKAVSLHGLKEKKAIVVVFLSFECPVSNSYSDTLAELAKTYGKQNVAFLGVNSSDDGDAAQIAKQA